MPDQIDAWWSDFERQAPKIDALFRRQDEWDLAEWMHSTLGAIHPEIMWEYGPAVSGPGHRLVLTPESKRELRPLVREILRRAPALPGWEFYEYRLPVEFEATVMTVQVRTGFELAEGQVQVLRGSFNCVDLLFSDLGIEGDDARGVAFIATEALLGEETLDRWIGIIDVPAEPDPDGPPPIPISELRQAVENEVEQIREQLPERPWYLEDVDEAEWSALKGEPDTADDYPGQADLFVGITVLPEMLKCALVGVPFDSTRFSRCGERFCYLKIDGSEGLDESQFADREEIEIALNERLRPEALGCVVGGGTGIRYSYIELALVDPDTAWPTIRTVLQDGNLPERTWLLFHDDELANVWHGLYDSTPTPP
jgi:hypothetical protein